MNWGKKILFVYIAFVVGIAIMVVKSMNQNQDLVTPDYYQEELAYQKVIDQSAHTAKLSMPIQLQYDQSSIQIHFPADFESKNIKGNVKIYCPNDAKKDKQEAFELKNSKVPLMIPYVGSGLRKVILKWNCNGLDYFDEQKIFLN